VVVVDADELPRSVTEVIDDEYLGVTGPELAAQGRTDEPTAAGDEHPMHPLDDIGEAPQATDLRNGETF
jgi:hypothetical protein